MVSDDLELLRPEVRNALSNIEAFELKRDIDYQYRAECHAVIRAELRRLAKENAELRKNNDVLYGENVALQKVHVLREADLAALKLRIDAEPDHVAR